MTSNARHNEFVPARTLYLRQPVFRARISRDASLPSMCPQSALVRQIGQLEQGRISGSS